MHLILYQYRPKPNLHPDFERAYGPDGDWALLFQRSPDYLGTELLRSLQDPTLYVTIDRWTSQAAYEAFRTRWLADYEALDRRCDALTEREELIGSFLTLTSTSP